MRTNTRLQNHFSLIRIWLVEHHFSFGRTLVVWVCLYCVQGLAQKTNDHGKVPSGAITAVSTQKHSLVAKNEPMSLNAVKILGHESVSSPGVLLPYGEFPDVLLPVLSSSVPMEIPLIPPVRSTVKVNALEQQLVSGQEGPYYATQPEVLSSAGTWGDFSRYFQLMPGVVGNGDMSNEMIVRGGNPLENLYVVDGIEVPNINHLALAGGTGGFTSMLDTATVDSIEMKPGQYDVRYASRLSSLFEIHTISGLGNKRAGELDLGISGGGGFVQQPLTKNSSLLLSARRGVLNMVTNDIGINGVPVYTNGMGQMEWVHGMTDHVLLLSLNGADSINITPNPCDPGVSSRVQAQYGGNRSTNGLVWQHAMDPSIVSTLTVSYSFQRQLMNQQEQRATSCHIVPIYKAPELYNEHSMDGTSKMGYTVQFGRRNWLYSVGAEGRLVQADYAVAQPLGQQSPFDASGDWTDAANFHSNAILGQTAWHASVTGTLKSRWTLMVGAREETFALTGAHMFEPHSSIAVRVTRHQALNVSYARLAQLAPTINLLSYEQNRSLLPMKVEHLTVGAELWRTERLTVNLAAYRKRYWNEPVSTEYSSLMLANMVSTINQQMILLPMTSSGHGLVQGVEMLLRGRAGRYVQLLDSVSYSHTRYAAADGVMRPGNFDLRLVGNSMVTLQLPWKLEAAVRDTYTSGRPFTPFDLTLSKKQSRGIYDLTQVNAQRGPAYNRVDIDMNKILRVHGRTLKLYAGMENILNRENVMGYSWMSQCKNLAPGARFCGSDPTAFPGIPEAKITIMPAWPSAGVRYVF